MLLLVFVLWVGLGNSNLCVKFFLRMQTSFFFGFVGFLMVIGYVSFSACRCCNEKVLLKLRIVYIHFLFKLHDPVKESCSLFSPQTENESSFFFQTVLIGTDFSKKRH